MRFERVRFCLLATISRIGVVHAAGEVEDAPPPASDEAMVVQESDAARPAEEPARSADYRVDFSAGKVEVDAKLKELELSEHVVVKVDRYRITADKLKLSRGPRGIVIDGDGRVAFCRCETPPFSFGFSSATAAPPTDLLIEDPTFFVYDVPVLWLPYLWLRAPDRFGVLPPRVAWRGDDGLLLGSGVHIPLASAHDLSRVPSLDLEGAGYIEGGAEVKSRLTTSRDSVEARFDYKRESLLALDARGAHTTESYATWAYRADAIRGPRGLTGTISLNEAAQRYDRVRAEVGRHDGRAYYALGGSSTAARGGDFDETGVVGPIFVAGLGDALGSVGDGQLALFAATRNDPLLGPTSTLRQLAELNLHARPGPLGAEFELAQQSFLASSELVAESLASVGGRGQLTLPFARRFGVEDPWSHTIVPLLAASVRHSWGDSVLGEVSEPGRTLAKWGGGVRTTLGRWGMKAGVELDTHAGWVLLDSRTREVLDARLLGTTRYFAANAEVVSLPREPVGWVESARVRLGPETGPQLSAYVEGQRGLAVDDGHWLLDTPLSSVLGAPWYDTSGYTTGGEARVPWTRTLASALAGDYDVEARELLGIRGSVAYRHPCGCFATVAWAGRRIARPGVDAWLTMDLMP